MAESEAAALHNNSGSQRGRQRGRSLSQESQHSMGPGGEGGLRRVPSRTSSVGSGGEHGGHGAHGHRCRHHHSVAHDQNLDAPYLSKALMVWPSHVSRGEGEGASSQGEEDDDERLSEIGYKAELYRSLGAFTAFSIDFNTVSVLTSISVLYGYALKTGGPATLVWGWLLTWGFTVVCAFSLGEICSTFPTAGGVYSWAGELCPKEWAPFWSYFTGWANALGYLAGTATFAYSFAQTFNAALSIDLAGEQDAVYQLSQPIMVAISIGVLAVWAGINALRIDQVAWIMNISSVWQMLTTLGIMVCLLCIPSQRNNLEAVWTKTVNHTGFPDSAVGYVYLIGLLPSLYGFTGYDSCTHMAEETTHPSTSVPRGMVYTCLISGLTGLIYILGLLYSTTDIDEVLSIGPDASIATYVLACGPTVGRVLAVLLVSNVFLAGISAVTVTSRTCFAMARDKAFPFSSYLSHIHPTLQMPLRIVGAVFLVNALLLLLPLGTPLAFTAITSVCTIGAQISYAIPIFFRITTARRSFHRCDFHLGKWSIPLGWASVAWLVGTALLFFLPTEWPVTAKSMNYSCAIVFGFLGVGGLYWAAQARYHYPGPVRVEDQSDLELDDDDAEELMDASSPQEEQGGKGAPPGPETAASANGPGLKLEEVKIQ